MRVLVTGACGYKGTVLVPKLLACGHEVTEVLPHFMGRINTFHNATYHRDIGTIQSLATAQTEYRTALCGSDRAR